MESIEGRRGRFWRAAPWAAAALLWLMPAVAMRFSDEVDWDATDFAVFGAMLLAACGAWELAARATASAAYRAAVGVAVAAAFILVWMNLAVGIIGSEDDPANLMYLGVLAIGAVGASLARFRPRGMARAMVATAVAQALAGAIAVAGGLGAYGVNWPRVIVVLSGFFVALWLLSAWLFGKAARAAARGGAAS